MRLRLATWNINSVRPRRELIGRTNSITGVAYNAEPAILGWELVNEARCSRG